MSEKPRSPESEGALNCICLAENAETKLDLFVDFEDKKTGDLIVIGDKRSDNKVQLNDYLPDGWRFKFTPESRFTFTDPGTKKIKLGGLDLPPGDWSNLLTILHEIGHSENCEEEPNRVRRMNELNTRAVHAIPKPGYAILSKELSQLESSEERDAWAKALKMLRDIVKKLGIEEESLDLSNDQISENVRESLLSYKEFAVRSAKIHEGEGGQDLRQTVSRLYTNKKTKKNLK